jgi:hypothetical protein
LVFTKIITELKLSVSVFTEKISLVLAKTITSWQLPKTEPIYQSIHQVSTMPKGRICSYKKEKKNISNVFVSKKQNSFLTLPSGTVLKGAFLSLKKKKGMER